MHQGAVSACYVSETEHSVLATRNISAFVTAFFFPIWGSAVAGVEYLSIRDEINGVTCHSPNTRV